MATNCLVQKLLSPVENDALPRLGELIIKRVECPVTFNADTAQLSIQNSKACTVRVTGNGLIAQSYADLSDESQCVTEAAVPANTLTTLYFSDGNYEIGISEKYTLTRLVGSDDDKDINAGLIINLEDLKYCTSLSRLQITSSGYYPVGIYGDIANLKNTSLTRLWANKTNPSSGTILAYPSNKLYGDIANLPDTLDYLFVGHNTGIYGNIANLPSSCSKLNIVNTSITGTVEALGQHSFTSWCHFAGTKITGSIEDFVHTMDDTAATNNFFSYGILGQLYFGDDIKQENTTTAHSLYWEPGTRGTKIWVKNSSSARIARVRYFTEAEIAEKFDSSWTVINMDPE